MPIDWMMMSCVRFIAILVAMAINLLISFLFVAKK